MFVWTGMAEGGQTRDQGITEFKTGPMERGRLGDDGSCSLSHLHHAGNGRRRRDCHLGQARGLGLQLNGWEMLTDCSPCFGLLWATQLKFSLRGFGSMTPRGRWICSRNEMERCGSCQGPAREPTTSRTLRHAFSHLPLGT